MTTPTIEEAKAEASAVLEAAWDDERGYSYPNPTVYPHQWLWDSCFHSIAWAALGDQRAVKELEAVFEGQLASGFVPHMRYAEPSQYRGPLDDRSGYTQPPVYGHALAVGVRSGLAVPDALIARVGAAYDYLWRERRTSDGLLRIVHPWEAGARLAKEMLFTGRAIGADEAYMRGMVNKVVARDDLEAETLAMASHIAKRPMFGLTLAKQSVNQTLDAQGQHTSIQSAFSLHHVAHSNNMQVHNQLVDPAGIKVIRDEA